MKTTVNGFLTEPDLIVLRNLLQDVDEAEAVSSDARAKSDDQASMDLLKGLNDENSPTFEPTVFTGWDLKDVPIADSLKKSVLFPYVRWAQRVVRRPTDVVFLTHIILYLSTSVPSAIYLYYHFSWIHGVCHWLMQAYYCGPFTLMLHNHIHNHGVLDRKYALFDQTWPYILEPLMGHTWDSYFYHHVKHHHTENNGPDDLSSTIRYQRDELRDFAIYVGRFMFFVWLELPIYFLRKRKPGLAIRTLISELSSYLLVYLLAAYDFRPTLFVLILPLIQMRIGMMVGNWGQHAFVDEEEPDSDFRSSITLIDVPSNRFCFNDGWHTAHHLNPLRHWRDHPLSFLKAKDQYRNGRALVFHNIDYLEITYRLMRKDYDHLARCLVPIGNQIGMSLDEVADMLRTKTLRFTEADIQKKYPNTLKPTDRVVYFAFLSLALYTFKATITSDPFQKSVYLQKQRS